MKRMRLQVGVYLLSFYWLLLAISPGFMLNYCQKSQQASLTWLEQEHICCESEPTDKCPTQSSESPANNSNKHDQHHSYCATSGEDLKDLCKPGNGCGCCLQMDLTWDTPPLVFSSIDWLEISLLVAFVPPHILKVPGQSHVAALARPLPSREYAPPLPARTLLSFGCQRT